MFWVDVGATVREKDGEIVVKNLVIYVLTCMRLYVNRESAYC